MSDLSNEQEVKDVPTEHTKQKKRHRKKYHPWLRLLIKLIIVAIVIVIGVLMWKNWRKIAPEAVLDWMEIRFGDASIGRGFPVAVDGNTVKDIEGMDRYLVALTDTSLHFYNPSASRVVTRNHSFADPALDTAGRYVLLTEIGGSRLRLETRRETLLTTELENRKIYASCLLSSGMFAVVTDSSSQSFLCEIQVFDRKGNRVFSYQSRKYLLTNLSLADDGNGLAAVGTTAEGGVLKSVLLMFDFSNTEPIEYWGTDVLLYDVNCYENNTVLAVGDAEVWVLPSRGDTVEKIKLDGYEPIGFSATPTLAGLSVRRSGSTGDDYVWIFDDNGSLWKSEQLEGSFRNISCTDSQVFVLTDSHAFRFGKNVLEEQIETPSDALLITPYRDVPLLLTLSELKRPS